MNLPMPFVTNSATSRLGNSFFTALGVCAFVSTLTACAGNPGTQLSSDLNPCAEPRPEICTAHYDPVCGTRNDGSTATYATSCTACADAQVAGWIAGECAD